MRKNFSRGAVALAAALTTAVPLVIAASPAAAYVFSDVKIEGSNSVEAGTILSYVNIPRGRDVSAGQLNDAQQRLQNAGLFEAVEILPQGNTLLIRVQEYPVINIINFEGNRRLKDTVLAEIVSSRARRVFSPSTAEEDARKISQAYAVEGRLAARVEPRIIRRDGNRVDLVFEIKEGAVTEIERVGFTGNRTFSDRRLRQVLQTKQAGMLRAFIKADTFNPDRLPLDEKLLTDFYRSRGFADFRVQAVSPEVARERDAFYVTFNIYEGPRYVFGNVDVVSEVSGLDATEFVRLNRVQSGQVYNPQAVDATIGRLEGLATARGLDFVAVEPRIQRNPQNGTLDLTLALVRGPRVFVERIDIEGNTTTLDEVIRRQFRTVEGDPFNPREIRNAAERIRALGYFGDSQVGSRAGSSEQQVIVDVNVEEQPTGSLSFGASYGANAGVGFNASLMESNFLGRGQMVGVSISTAKSSRAASFDFGEPAFMGRDLNYRFSLWYRETDRDNVKFNTKSMGVTNAIDFPVSPNGRLQLRYRLTNSEMTDVEEIHELLDDKDNPTGVFRGSSPIIYREGEMGALTTSSLGYEYSFDSRRERIDPNTAYKFRIGQDFAGVGGDVKSVTTTVLAGVESRAWREEVTLLAEFEAGGVHMLDDQVSRYIDRYSGSHVRGFESSGYGPRDLQAPNEDALGGNYYWVVRAEAQFPLGLPEEYGIRGGLFADAGSVWGLDDKNGYNKADPTTFAEVDDGMKIRASVGASLFWTTPIGPLRFNFSKAVRKEDYDETQPFDMTISTRF